jgi:Lipocalin-like domain
MHRLCVMSVAVLTSGVLAAASSVADKLVGSWKLISYEVFTSATAEATFPLGRDAVGRITYDASGRMSVQGMQPGRPRSDGIRQGQGTPEQMLAAYRGYLAYFGTYRVDEARGVVIHKVEGSLYPNNVGSEQLRRYSFSGNRLILEAELALGGRTRLVWERLP